LQKQHSTQVSQQQSNQKLMYEKLYEGEEDYLKDTGLVRPVKHVFSRSVHRINQRSKINVYAPKD